MQPRPRTPSESARAVRVMPGVSIGTRNAVTPWPRMPGRVAAITIVTDAASALATHTFRPVIRYPSPERTARVCWLAASVPASASDKANAPIASPLASRGSQCRLCDAVPAYPISSLTSGKPRG